MNLIERVLEIYRDPRPDPAAPYGFRYRSIETLRGPAIAVPLAIPAARIAVADLLP